MAKLTETHFDFCDRLAASPDVLRIIHCIFEEWADKYKPFLPPDVLERLENMATEGLSRFVWEFPDLEEVMAIHEDCKVKYERAQEESREDSGWRNPDPSSRPPVASPADCLEPPKGFIVLSQMLRDCREDDDAGDDGDDES